MSPDSSFWIHQS